MSTTNYKQLSSELDDILEQLQSADLDIDQAVNLHERGTALVKKLETHLKTAENKITKLTTKFDSK